MVAICSKCGKDCQNKQALKIHEMSCKGSVELKKEEASEPALEEKMNERIEESSSSIDLEIEEPKKVESDETKIVNRCVCGHAVTEDMVFCPNCDSELIWR